MVLTRSQARAFYDRFGEKQDNQGFYEDAALEQLVAHAAFERAERVFELGCGTGRFAAGLLAESLAPSATYLGTDLSQTMIDIAGGRVAPFGERAKVELADGSLRFPVADASVDRVVATYVLDLLSEAEIGEAIAEARRVLTPAGKLCLVSLTTGASLASKLVSRLWAAVFRLRASLVGGCRPIALAPRLDPGDWSVEYRNVVTQTGVASEVLIASPRADRSPARP